MQKKRALMGVACTLLMIPALAVRADETPVPLARTVKEGDTLRTRITVNASLGGNDLVVVQTFKTAVKEINKKGQIVWEQTTESVTVNDAPQAEAAGTVQTETREKNNRLVDFKPPMMAQEIFSPEVQRLIAANSEILFPDKPVKPGDSWTTEFENPIVKGKKVETKTTFVGLDKVDGKDFWKVKQATTAATDETDGKTVTEMTCWLDPADGSTIKMEGSVKDLPVAQLGSLSWKMKMEKLKAEKTDKADKSA